MKIIKKLSFIFCLFVSLFVLINCNNKRNENDLTSAIYDGNLKKMKKLLKKGYNVHGYTKRENSLYGGSVCNLVRACTSNSSSKYEIAQLLIDYGSDVTFVSELYKEDEILRNDRKYLVNFCNDKDMVQFLIDHEAPFDEDCGNGVTPLMIFVKKLSEYCDNNNDEEYISKQFEIMSTLIQNGADINHRSDNGITNLMLALDFNARPVVDFLLEKGCEVHKEFVKFQLYRPANYRLFRFIQ